MAALLALGVLATALYWAITSHLEAEGLEEVLTLPLLAAVVLVSLGTLIAVALAEKGSARARSFLRVTLFMVGAGSALVAIWPPPAHALQELAFAVAATAAAGLYSRPKTAADNSVNPEPPPLPR